MDRRFALFLAAALAAAVASAQAPAPRPAPKPGEAPCLEGSAGRPGHRGDRRDGEGQLHHPAAARGGPEARRALRQDREGRRLRRDDLPPGHHGRHHPGRRPALEGPGEGVALRHRGPRPAEGELSDRPFVRGHGGGGAPALGASTAAASSSSVVMREQPSLKGQYTVFGEVVSGMEVVDQISTTPADGGQGEGAVEMKVRVQEKAPE